MEKGIRWLILLCLLLGFLPAALGDEEVRRVQEELRKRNLYFGDINGQATSDLAVALKRYQTRKGFTPTGRIDEVTAYSLNVRSAEETPSQTQPPLPDVPILKSDFAQRISGSGAARAREDFGTKSRPRADSATARGSAAALARFKPAARDRSGDRLPARQ